MTEVESIPAEADRAPSEADTPRRGWHAAQQHPVFGRLLGRLHIFGVFWYWMHYMGARYFITGPFGNAFFVTFFYCFLGRTRRAVNHNLDVVLGTTSWWGRHVRAYKTFWRFADCRSSRYESLQPSRRRVEIALDGRENWERMMSRRGGFVVLTAHIGCYEAGAIVPGDIIRRRLHQVRNVEPDPRTQQFVEEIIAKYSDPNCVTHYMSEENFPDVKTGLTLLKAVRSGDIVAMPGDRAPTHGKVIETELFGHPYLIPEGPFGFARSAGVPLITLFCFFEKQGKFRLVFRRPIEIPRTADRTADAAEAAQQFAEDLEWAIRRKPHQWFAVAPVF